MKKVQRSVGLSLLSLAALVACVAAVDAGTLKGYVYHTDGTVLKTPTVSITVKNTKSTPETIGAGNSKSDGSFSVSFDSTKLHTDNLITVEFKRSGGTDTTTVSGGLSGTAVTHTLHVIVKP